MRTDTIAHDVTPRPHWLSAEQWPHPIRTIRTGDHTIAYTDTGAGPTLLLVHTGMWSFVWRDVIGRLESSFRCVTLDAPGAGLTGGSSRVDIGVAADAVDAVVRGLDLDDLTLVFHDIGGPASLEAAARWPERLRGVAAINAFGWQPSGAAFRGMLAVMGSGAMRELDAWTGWLPAITSTRIGVGRNLDRRDRRTFRKGMTRHGRRSMHRYLRSARTHDFAAIDAAVEQLSHLPLLTIFGANNDPLGFQRQWADRFDDITQLKIPKGNHYPMCDAPDAVADALTDWYRTKIAR